MGSVGSRLGAELVTSNTGSPLAQAHWLRWFNDPP